MAITLVQLLGSVILLCWTACSFALRGARGVENEMSSGADKSKVAIMRELRDDTPSSLQTHNQFNAKLYLVERTRVNSTPRHPRFQNIGSPVR